MQTFLPYPDFRESAAVLDTPRLGKQRVENYQILRALTWPTYAWKNHPAVRMWRGFVPALVVYGFAICDAWEAAGRADSTRRALLDFTGGVVPDWQELYDTGQLPPWIGRDDVHRSHQASLVRKDPGRYRPFFPDVSDDLPYSWPESVFPRWPVRRGPSGPLDIEVAAALVGLPEPPTKRRSSTSSAPAANTSVAGPDAPVTASSRVCACRGGRCWAVDGPTAGRAGSATTTDADRGAYRPTQREEPGPEEVAAMAAESAPPEFAFFRPSQDRDDLIERMEAGLIVVDADSWRPDALRRLDKRRLDKRRSVPTLSIERQTEEG